MDVNGHRFHLLLGERDWRPLVEAPTADGLAWSDDDRTVRLRPLAFLFRVHGATHEEPLRPDQRRGAAIDRYGNRYWIGPDRRTIRTAAADARVGSHSWRPGDGETPPSAPATGAFASCAPPRPPPPLTLQGLTVTTDHFLVAGVLDPPSLLVFDLHGVGPPLQLLWPAAIPLSIQLLTARPQGGIVVVGAGEPQRYWRLDRDFRPLAADQDEVELRPERSDLFGPVDGAPRTFPAESFPAGHPLVHEAPITVRDVAVLPDDTLLVLDGDAAFTVHRFRRGEHLGAVGAKALILEHVAEDQHARLDGLTGHALALVETALGPEGEATATLLLVGSDGNQAFAFDLTAPGAGGLKLTAQTRYLPMRRFSGKALLSDGKDAFYDFGERWLPLLAQSRPRFEPKGQLITPAFDGKEFGCVWHRVFLDAVIPPGARAMVESAASDEPGLPGRLDPEGEGFDPDLAATLEWQPEPLPYRRGQPDLPHVEPFPVRAGEGAGTYELLLQHARGRYLALRLTLEGTGVNTPRLQALRATYPRFSYLQYLPAIYRQDAASADFLERWLANVEGLFTSLEERIAAAEVLLDVDAAPADALDWLAGWLGIPLDESWHSRRRRLFLRHAPWLFARRGTVPGLIKALRLATEPAPDDALFEDPQCDAGGYGIRVKESFLARPCPLDPARAGWSPAAGAAPLDQRFAEWIASRYAGVPDDERIWGDPAGLRMPALMPAHPACAADWQRFVATALGFPYAPVRDLAPDRAHWRRFLARRHPSIEALNNAWQLPPGERHGTFAEVPLPRLLPAGGPALEDWIRFVSVQLPRIQGAHRFTVQVPIRADALRRDPTTDLDLVRRIVALEKPAHTAFAVEGYFAMFRVGEARLGIDTRLDQRQRDVALVLGAGEIGRDLLRAGHPFDVEDRLVVGRDRPGDRPRL